MSAAVALVGMACRYPGARSPAELWENVLAGRRAFRRIPGERLRLADYASTDRHAADRTYLTRAAVIEDWEFDRVRFRVSGDAYRAADPAHWLALEVAAAALEDARFPGGEGLPRESTGVLVGNSLTGEFSRANLMRLRWPYVRRVVDAELADAGWGGEARRAFLAAAEARYKAPFPPVGEETLAGGLSNTIAGRICNHFDLKGGGFTVDGACASSLLAVAQGCSALAAGDLDVVVAGGVDLSLDPFELVGFARTGALAEREMRVFDERSAGFWPGEGCAMVVLLRYEDALARRLPVYALVRGWGISSDGAGGLTRPEEEGQLLAFRRAYARAGFGADSVAYFEGHGTGTAIGDATELRVLSRARQGAPGTAAVGSVKAVIGHTKAAAGVAGLVKAAMALHAQVIPPATGCIDPHPGLRAGGLRAPAAGEPWPAEVPLRAGVSAMGFGGINAHVVLEGAAVDRRGVAVDVRTLLRSAQDEELFCVAAEGVDALAAQVRRLAALAPGLSLAEMADLAVGLQRVAGAGSARAAVVAGEPEALARGLDAVAGWIGEGVGRRIDSRAGIFLSVDAAAAPRIGLLFPGQGSPAHLDGGAVRRRFDAVDALYAEAEVPDGADGVATEVAQPAIARASLAAVAVLDALGVDAVVAVGHSLGELAALCWAGAFDSAALLRIAAARGAAMGALVGEAGAMAALDAARETIDALLAGSSAVVAGVNGPGRTVVAGVVDEVAEIIEQARSRGIDARRLAVSHAFHSPLVAPAAAALAEHLAAETVGPLRRRVASTVLGRELGERDDVREVLVRQVTSPVLFADALSAVGAEAELWIEAGPGHALTALASDQLDAPVVALDACGPSLGGVLRAAGAAWTMGAPVRLEALWADRFARPFDSARRPRFLASPCESAPLDAGTVPASMPASSADARPAVDEGSMAGAGSTALDVVRALVAERAELPADAVHGDHRLLGDLHLNSITVGEIVARAARRLGVAPPASPTGFAAATVAEVARALEERAAVDGPGIDSVDADDVPPPGIGAWVRAFTVDLVESLLPRSTVDPDAAGEWEVLAPPDHPIANPLRTALAARAPGGGVAVCLPPDADERHLGLLLDAARAAGASGRFLLAQQGGGGAAFARTLALEAPEATVCVVDLPVDCVDAAGWAAEEARTARGYVEAHYGADGVRRVPRLRLAPSAGGARAGIDPARGIDSASGIDPASVDPASDIDSVSGIDSTSGIDPTSGIDGTFGIDPTMDIDPTSGIDTASGIDPTTDIDPTSGIDPAPLTAADVLLATGGGKGITAECALALARDSGASLAVLGTARPEEDAVLAANLARFAAAGVRARYVAADLADAAAVRSAVREAEAALGPVTAVLHGAGINTPRLIADLDEEAMRTALAPKVAGLRNLLAPLDADRLRLLVSFGSVIARTGMRGEAAYALANEWLARETDRFAAAHPHCRALTLEWSVWSGVGMGARLGAVESLARAGVTPVSTDDGVAALRRLLAGPATGALVVGGRLGELPTLEIDRPPLPLHRFLERPRIHYPGVELVAEADLSAATDPYLADHVVRGEPLLPAVLGLEAMAAAAMALAGTATTPTFEEVRFERPVAVPAGGTARVRLCALAREDGTVDVALRAESTSYAADHFRARCRFGPASTPAPVPAGDHETIPLDPDHELYGTLFFHGGRFRRVQGYRRLRARACEAAIRADGAARWYGAYLPQTHLLGDPGARDAAIHAIQACIPHALVLPVGVRRIAAGVLDPAQPHTVRAREVADDGTELVYDLEIAAEDGTVRERWEGLRLRRVAALAEPAGGWAPALLGPYLERRVAELVPGASVSADVGGGGSEAAFRRAGVRVPVHRRPDGRPEVVDLPLALSASHAGALTLGIAGAGPLGCDLEPVAARDPALWRDLLGGDGWALAERVAREAEEGIDAAATRVWAAREALTKAGVLGAPLVIDRPPEDSWVVLASGAASIPTRVLRRADGGASVAAVLVSPAAVEATAT